MAGCGAKGLLENGSFIAWLYVQHKREGAFA